MDLASQSSFGPNLKKFKSSEHLHFHAYYVEIQHMNQTWEQQPLLPKKKIPPNI